MSKYFILLVFLSAIACSNDGPLKPENISSNSQIGLVTEKSSALRIEPFIYSSRIIDLPKGEKLEILDLSKKKSAVAKSIDYWYKVRTQNGITGWIFGANIKIFSAGSSFSVNNFEEQLKDEEFEKLSTELIGKWWSVNTQEEFTSYWIALFKNGEYEAKHKDSNHLFKGKYKIDAATSTISFDEGTPLGNEFKFTERGLNYFIEYADDKNNYRFKRISLNPKSEQEVETVEEKKESNETVPNQENNDKNQ